MAAWRLVGPARSFALESGLGSWSVDRASDLVGGLDSPDSRVERIDALDISHSSAEFFITNPPWSRPMLHALIEHLAGIKPTWLLLDADWAHTRQAVPYLKYCQRIIAVGRVKWIPGSLHTGKDNACWYLFSRYPGYEIWSGGIVFVGRE